MYFAKKYYFCLLKWYNYENKDKSIAVDFPSFGYLIS